MRINDRCIEKVEIVVVLFSTYVILLLLYTNICKSSGFEALILASLVVVLVVTVTVLADLLTLLLLDVFCMLSVSIYKILHGGSIQSSFAAGSTLVGGAKLVLDNIHLSIALIVTILVTKVETVHGVTGGEPDGVIYHPRGVAITSIISVFKETRGREELLASGGVFP